MEQAGRRSQRPPSQRPPRRLRRWNAQPQSLQRRHLLRRLQVPLRLRRLRRFLLFYMLFLQPRQQWPHPRHLLLQLSVRPQAIAPTTRESVEQ
jgi:hypothetical protein